MSINKEELEILRLAYDIKLLGLDENKFIEFVNKLRNVALDKQVPIQDPKHSLNVPHVATTLDDIQQSMRDAIEVRRKEAHAAMSLNKANNYGEIER